MIRQETLSIKNSLIRLSHLLNLNSYFFTRHLNYGPEKIYFSSASQSGPIVAMDCRDWERFGYPSQITVTIRPGAMVGKDDESRVS